MRITAVLTSLILFFSIHAFGQAKVSSADEILKPVYAKALAEDKKVMIIFHASWCGWCKKMDASLNDKEIQPLIDKYYVITHLTVHEATDKKALENAGAQELMDKYGGINQGLPYWLVFDKTGKFIANSQYNPGKNSGCPASEEEVAYFIRVLQNTSALSKDELERIKKRFRQNEN